jgi:6-phospho-beta-glucosidase
MASLHTGDGAVPYVNVRNDGILAGLGPDAVVGVPARVDRYDVHALAVTALPLELLTLAQSVTAYETLTLDAAEPVTAPRCAPWWHMP